MRVAESTYREQFLSNVEVAAQVEHQQNKEAGGASQKYPNLHFCDAPHL